MSHFAKIEDRIVVNVIVADEDFIVTQPGEWVQTSFNTHGGVHVNGGTPLRKNFAGLGYTYDYGRDAFIAPKPFPSWVLNEDTCVWEAPVVRPMEGHSVWDEASQTWTQVEE